MTGFIYAIESGDAVKIGYAADPVRRVAELNTGCPSRHRLIGFIEGTQNQERRLHSSLRQWRRRGEWFSKDGDVLNFLALLPPFKPKARKFVARPKSPPRPQIGPMEARLCAALKDLTDAFTEATDMSVATIGKRALNDNTFFQRVAAGDGFTLKTFDRVIRWFSDQWARRDALAGRRGAPSRPLPRKGGRVMGCDYDAPDFYTAKIRKARKPHRCEECAGQIMPGDTYEHVSGKWVDYLDTFVTCRHCVSLRQWVKGNVPCVCWAHGNADSDMREAVYEAYYRAPNETIGLRFGFLRRLTIRNRANASRVHAHEGRAA